MSEHSYTRIGQAMRPAPKMVDGLATVAEAIALMRSESISSLVVDRRHEGDEFGLVTVSDIAGNVIANNRSPGRVNVYEIMSKPVLTLSGEMDLKYAIRLLIRFGLSRALVSEGGNLAGIVTMRDMVIRYLADADGSKTPG